jgi:4-amino-4-deoxy-L-arabinose transferase-like glycosyltransferase
MADMRRFGLLDFLLLVLVFAAAGGARAGYLLACAHGGEARGPLRVQELPPANPAGQTEQKALIENVRDGFWFASEAPFAAGEETTAHVAPGYPYLVGLLAKQVPSDKVEFIVRWAQVGLGAFAAAFYYLFARRAFRSLTAGTVAGLFAAFHPYWVVEVANMSDATLASTALALAVFLGGQAGEKGGAFTSLLLGAALAGLALVRAAYLPFSFVMLVWFLLRSRTLRLGWLCALCAFLGFGAALSPWTIRNYQEFNEPVPVVSSTYLHLWVGNNPKATGGPATDEMFDDTTTAELERIPGQPARYAQLGKGVAQEVRDRPVKTIQRRLYATLYFLFGQRWFSESVLAENVATEADPPAWVRDNYVVVFHAVLFGMLALTFLGWRWSYGWRWESVPAALAMMWVPLPYILGHAGSLSGARLPLDGVMLCFSAFALCCFLPGVGGHLLGGAENATTTPAEQS